MLDKADLEAIRSMVKEVVQETVQEVIPGIVQKEASESESRVTRRMAVLMDAEFRKNYELLAEQVQIMQETRVPPERVDAIRSDVDVLKLVVREHSDRLGQLEQAM